jgi:methionine sulfoxide reductase catalytic subunit
MLTKKAPDLSYSEVTPKDVYLNRRRFLIGVAGAAVTGAAVLGYKKFTWVVSLPAGPVTLASKLSGVIPGPYSTDEKQTTLNDVTHYNNFYEFGTGKEDPAENARKFVTSPWTVSVEGEVSKPRKFSMEEIMKLAPLEQRIYRHRCVEAWSIVVPWIGFPLSVLINLVQPTSRAKYVAFESYYDVKQMPLGPDAGISLPYAEGLRLDEAMNPLTLLTVGMYDQTLANQDGAPVRIVVPWKYGFKSAKSLVKIKFVDSQPATTWNDANSQEYGFYSNVNPNVDHPRWSQATERRLGEFSKRQTLMFNGYADQVASLYNGMDLKKYY